ncbi:hypothetical protein [Citrobacter freundii]|uniref:hypothetical protein n=1 Tax=Citrobacter freundii TaxID=546 RepID=UPI002DB9A94C|nr:hypothetical protein [Citrobacter freundii]MEB6425730.1 hypothetical protein [Citrobacter freundii]
MKLMGNLCCLAFLVWAISFFVKSEDKQIPSNEVLISQFEKMGIFTPDQWEKGNVVDGVQVYTAKTDDNILKSSWLLGVKQAGVISVTAKNDPAFSVISALSTCYKLVKGVVARDEKPDFKVVEKAFKQAISSEPVDNAYSDTEVIADYRFKVQMGTIGSNLYSYACSIKAK